ncbi:tethering complex subunit PEP5 [Sporobolomyces koalae]|uniref:tethering complex subunit PEP5 n=1 Tax=Sporobolomyces koalae TaxID=500713 RepID=UPI003171CC92
MPTKTPDRDPAGQNGALAAPAWRQFTFFGSTRYPTGAGSVRDTPEVVQQPHLVSAIHSNPTLDDGLVLLADSDGNLNWINEDWTVERTWQAYDGGRVEHIETKWWDRHKARAIVVTIGDDASTPFPLLKLWLLVLPSAPSDPSTSLAVVAPQLTLLRQTPIAPTPNRPSPVSSLAVSPSLSHIVLGLTDGSVVGYKRIDELIETSLVDLDAVTRATETAAGAGANKRLPQFTVGGLGKLRIMWEVNKDPITNIGIASSVSTSSVPTLFMLTTSEVLALALPPSRGSSRHKHATPTVLDSHGAAIGCAKIMRLGLGRGVGEEGETAERMVVAREEAIYVYGSEGREGCWAYEGPKSAIFAIQSTVASGSTATLHDSSIESLPTPYLAIITPPQRASLSSQSKTIRQHASRSNTNPMSGTSPRIDSPGLSQEEQVSKVTMFDPDNKFIAFTAAYGDGGAVGGAGIRQIFEAWGSVWILTDSGQLHRLTEQPIQNSLVTLYQRSLYTLAISLAKSRGLGQPVVGEIYRKYGDHLYAKGDYEASMSCYLKTVGTVQASYVIRKFLDAQRLTHLTSYLQELHSRNLANSDITTLLLNCYTKLADDEALSRFIHSSSRSNGPARRDTNGEVVDEPPFDLETAIRVLRQASYFSHAIWLAQRYHLHSEFLRISMEDTSDYLGALRYIGDLAQSSKEEERMEAEKSMKRWAGLLLKWEPQETTKVLVDICCGTSKGQEVAAQTLPPAKSQNGTINADRQRVNGGGYDAPETASAIVNSTARPDAGSTPTPRTASPEPAELPPSPRQFFAHFVDHPREFIEFLEHIGARRYGKTIDLIRSTPSLGESCEPLPTPRALGALDYGDAETRDEQAVWNTLLELYVTSLPPKEGQSGEDEQEQLQLRTKAIKILQGRDTLPYDETQALLVCTTKGFVDGFVLIYELLGMYEDIVRYWIDASSASPADTSHSARLIAALRRYGPAEPSLYRVVLTYLTTSSALLTHHQPDVLSILDDIDEHRIMPPIEAIEILSKNGTASIGLVREYLKKQLVAEKQEIDSDQALIASYRTESAKKQKEIAELSDPNVPRIFQVTRCSACGGQLDLPGVHFMCRHSYHQRCLGENETECPNCARTHGVVREIRKNNEQLAGRHDLFLSEIADSEDSFATVASAFGRGWMSMASTSA